MRRTTTLLRRLHRPWIHAVVGSAFVVASTVATVSVYQLQNAIDSLQSNVAHNVLLIQRSQQHEDFGMLLYMLAEAGDTPAETSPQQRNVNHELRVIWQVAAVVRISMASQPNFDRRIADDIITQAHCGNSAAATRRALDLRQRFLHEAYQYRKRLEMFNQGCELNLTAFQRARNRRALLALTLQIVGLVLLLLKEIPEPSA